MGGPGTPTARHAVVGLVRLRLLTNTLGPEEGAGRWTLDDGPSPPESACAWGNVVVWQHGGLLRQAWLG